MVLADARRDSACAAQPRSRDASGAAIGRLRQEPNHRRWSRAECSIARRSSCRSRSIPKRRAGQRAAGRVIISVIVDETGKVISAEVEDGPILFRRVALEAARKARFKPTLVDGQPVKVSGILQYRFAPVTGRQDLCDSALVIFATPSSLAISC